MMPIRYFKAEPTEFARVTRNGKVKKEGAGISCFYTPFNTCIELIGMTAVDQPFVFKEASQDNQELNLQGGIIYRVEEPVKTIAKYNFAIDPATKDYLEEDSNKLQDFMVQLVRAKARKIVQGKKMEKLLVMADGLSDNVLTDLQGAEVIANLGLRVEMLYFDTIVPNPEIAKALGTEYRESLLQRADKATYARRAMAVEQERAIQENEMRNKIELETKRKELVDLQGKNVVETARYAAEAATMDMNVFEKLSPELLRARALYELGRNAAKIGTLTITPEVLAALGGR